MHCSRQNITSLVTRTHEANPHWGSLCRTDDLVRSEMSTPGNTEKAGAGPTGEGEEPRQRRAWPSLGWILNGGKKAEMNVVGQLGTLGYGLYVT